MPAYISRDAESTKNYVHRTPKEAYKDLNKYQFNEFARCHIKLNVMDASINPWFANLSQDVICEMNNFFEGISDFMLDFSTDTSRKLLMMYITTNIQFGFGYPMQDDAISKLYAALIRLAEIDPHLSCIPRK